MDKKNYTERDLMELADNMAAAASMFNAHGYDTFIHAREELKQALSKTIPQDTSSYKTEKVFK